MMTNTTIRPLIEADYASIQTLAEGLPDWFDETARTSGIPIDIQHQRGFVAERAGQVVGFNILNQTARTQVFPQTMAQDVAVQIMFAVRRALSQPDKLVAALQTLIEAGELDPSEVDLNNPLGFVLAESDASSLVDAAHRFCRYEPGVDVVLSGTGNPAHLQANIDSLCRPPLPEGVVQKLRHIFRHASTVTGQ